MAVSPTRRTRDAVGVAEELSAIADLSRVELVERWANAYGRPPPKGISRRLLEYAAAYHLQVQTFGGLSPGLRRKLRRFAETRPADKSVPAPKNGSPESLAPGTRLVREWHGRTYMVEVAASGFLWDGHQYRSLSEVARAITGARWSGPRFFGL